MLYLMFTTVRKILYVSLGELMEGILVLTLIKMQLRKQYFTIISQMQNTSKNVVINVQFVEKRLHVVLLIFLDNKKIDL